jgi:hypothetical protein
MAGELNPGGGSVVGGRVTAASEGGAVTVVIEASELPDPREYAAYLYRGTCAESTSETMTLNPVVTRPDRTGSSTTMVTRSLLAGDDPVSVRIFEPDGMAMACGELFPVASSTRGRPSAP